MCSGVLCFVREAPKRSCDELGVGRCCWAGHTLSYRADHLQSRASAAAKKTEAGDDGQIINSMPALPLKSFQKIKIQLVCEVGEFSGKLMARAGVRYFEKHVLSMQL